MCKVWVLHKSEAEEDINTWQTKLEEDQKAILSFQKDLERVGRQSVGHRKATTTFLTATYVITLQSTIILISGGGYLARLL